MGWAALTHEEKQRIALGLITRESVSQKAACHRTFSAPMPGALTDAPLTHECRYHVVETGECLCPCGARSLRPKDPPR